MSRSGPNTQSIEIFASLANWLQVANWLATSARISGGVVARGSPPMLSSLPFTSGTEMARRSSVLSLLTIGSGSFPGPASPVHEMTSNPAMPYSATVGTSGKSRQRALPVTARARNSPERMRALIGPEVAAMKSISP